MTRCASHCSASQFRTRSTDLRRLGRPRDRLRVSRREAPELRSAFTPERVAIGTTKVYPDSAHGFLFQRQVAVDLRRALRQGSEFPLCTGPVLASPIGSWMTVARGPRERKAAGWPPMHGLGTSGWP
jgi:hypothetical protein